MTNLEISSKKSIGEATLKFYCGQCKHEWREVTNLPAGLSRTMRRLREATCPRCGAKVN